MDFFDERILAALRDGKPRSFTTLLGEMGFSHNTLRQHLERDRSIDQAVAKFGQKWILISVGFFSVCVWMLLMGGLFNKKLPTTHEIE